MAFEGGDYPPRAFSQKYGKALAPRGVLLPPSQILSEGKQGRSVEATLRKGFRVTLKKLQRLRTACAGCGRTEGNFEICVKCDVTRFCSETCRQKCKEEHDAVCLDISDESVDQIVECFPSPVSLGKDILKGRGGEVKDWEDWFSRHTYLDDRISSATPVVSLWWSLTGRPNPGEDAIRLSLRRIISNTFSTVLTLGRSFAWFPDFPVPDREVRLHLIGADEPEVSAVESGIAQILSRCLGRNVALTLVAPDLIRHPQTLKWSLENPLKVSPKVSCAAFHGLYHEFWSERVDSGKNRKKNKQVCSPPDIAVALHPGIHTPEMMALWRPTVELLLRMKIPLLFTTYNEQEYLQTLKELNSLNVPIELKGLNPLRSLLTKQTPYEATHIWAANSYVIAIRNHDD